MTRCIQPVQGLGLSPEVEAQFFNENARQRFQRCPCLNHLSNRELRLADQIYPAGIVRAGPLLFVGVLHQVIAYNPEIRRLSFSKPDIRSMALRCQNSPRSIGSSGSCGTTCESTSADC